MAIGNSSRGVNRSRNGVHSYYREPTCILLSSSSSSSSSSFSYHWIGPPVDSFRFHTSRSFFNGLPWFLLHFGL